MFCYLYPIGERCISCLINFYIYIRRRQREDVYHRIWYWYIEGHGQDEIKILGFTDSLLIILNYEHLPLTSRLNLRLSVCSTIKTIGGKTPPPWEFRFCLLKLQNTGSWWGKSICGRWGDLRSSFGTSEPSFLRMKIIVALDLCQKFPLKVLFLLFQKGVHGDRNNLAQGGII